MEIAVALEASWLATALRRSVWIYPLVNTAHILGVAMLVGAVLPMDLRLAGLWRTGMPLRDVVALLRPVAIAGFLLAASAGALLFVVQAQDYAAMPLFAAKLALISAALANALVVGRRLPELSPQVQRRTGLISVLLWLSVLVCGRMLGYL